MRPILINYRTCWIDLDVPLSSSHHHLFSSTVLSRHQLRTSDVHTNDWGNGLLFEYLSRNRDLPKTQKPKSGNVASWFHPRECICFEFRCSSRKAGIQGWNWRGTCWGIRTVGRKPRTTEKWRRRGVGYRERRHNCQSRRQWRSCDLNWSSCLWRGLSLCLQGLGSWCFRPGRKLGPRRIRTLWTPRIVGRLREVPRMIFSPRSRIQLEELHKSIFTSPQHF